MNSIETLLAKAPRSAQARLVCNGIVCWIVYPQALSVSFFQSLSDMGGWMVAEESTQSLWFFPSPTIMTGLGRLHNWARLNPIVAAITVFEASLVVSEEFSQSLAVKAERAQLSVEYPKRLAIRVSPQLREQGRGMTGIAFKQAQVLDGLTGNWFDLESSEQVSVSLSSQWLWVVKPMSSGQDKIFLKGWRAYFEHIEPLLVQTKASYLHGEDHVLVIKVSSLRALARLALDIMALNAEKGIETWPCVYAVMEMGGLSFAPDLGRKLQHVLEALEPNILYMPLSTVFQIADQRIRPVDSRFSLAHTKISDLFQVRISGQGGGRRHGSLNIILPSNFVSGSESPCFYCGLRSHSPRKCPSRRLQPSNITISELDRFARFPLENLARLFQEFGKQVGKDVGPGLTALLAEKNDMATIAGAFFEINLPCQLRMMAMVWRAKGKEWPHGVSELREQGDEMIWSALDAMRIGSSDRAAKQLEQCVFQSPKSYQPRVLLGFMAMERDEHKRAEGYWQEAEGLAYTSLQRSYIQLLQGRLRETHGDFQAAIFLYARALRESPGFLQARYRQAVCLVKSGFLAEAQGMFRDLIQSDPDYFSIMLLDPELEGGRTPVLADLWDIWMDVQERAGEVIGTVEHLPDLLAKWLPRDHEAYQHFHDRIQGLGIHADVANYVSMARLIRGTLQIRDEIQARVKKDIKELSQTRKAVLERMREIQREASWFPFPGLLRSFNRVFNRCAEQLRLIGEMDLYVPEKFRRAHEAIREAQDGLYKLEKKLLFLQAVRNGMLFLLLSGKYFLFFEITALVLSGILSVGLFYLVPDQTFMGRDLRQDRWLILNISLLFFSFIAFVVTVVRAAAKFESYKNKVLDKGAG